MTPELEEDLAKCIKDTHALLDRAEEHTGRGMPFPDDLRDELKVTAHLVVAASWLLPPRRDVIELMNRYTLVLKNGNKTMQSLN